MNRIIDLTGNNPVGTEATQTERGKGYGNGTALVAMLVCFPDFQLRNGEEHY